MKSKKVRVTTHCHVSLVRALDEVVAVFAELPGKAPSRADVAVLAMQHGLAPMRAYLDTLMTRSDALTEVA